MKTRAVRPIMLATWSFGLPAIDAAWPSLIGAEGSALAAVEAACVHAESDLSNQTVGVGGLPDREGDVSLDAAMMVSPSRRGGVCNIRSFAHPISLARRVMEKTPHTLLAGPGAEVFAFGEGFQPEALLTPEAKHRWERWKAEHDQAGSYAAAPIANFEEHPVSRASLANVWHDTIGVLALDGNSEVVAACSTSGLPWKMAGRVGDSPIIGHGLYADPGIGACVCTGHGELVSGICGAFLAVENLRRGHSPRFAAMEVIRRIEESYTLTSRDQVGVIVLSDQGAFAAASLQAGFRIAIRDDLGGRLVDPDFVLASERQTPSHNVSAPAAQRQEENFQLEMQ